MNAIIYRYPTHLSISHSFLDNYTIGVCIRGIGRGCRPACGRVSSGNCGAGGTVHELLSPPLPRQWSVEPVISMVGRTGYLNGRSNRLSQWTVDPVISMVGRTGYLNGRSNWLSQWTVEPVIAMDGRSGYINGRTG